MKTQTTAQTTAQTTRYCSCGVALAPWGQSIHCGDCMVDAINALGSWDRYVATYGPSETCATSCEQSRESEGENQVSGVAVAFALVCVLLVLLVPFLIMYVPGPASGLSTVGNIFLAGGSWIFCKEELT